MKELTQLIAVFFWIAGIILAKGFWSTFFAVILPLWSYVVVVYTGLVELGWIVQ